MGQAPAPKPRRYPGADRLIAARDEGVSCRNRRGGMQQAGRAQV